MLALSLLVVGLILCLHTMTAQAAINPQINFQGKLTNPDGTNVADGTYSVVFTIYSGGTSSGGGSSVWTETQGSLSVSSGNFQVQLGSVNNTLSSAVDFSTTPLFLGIKVGADAEMTPLIQFTATPYAFNSDRLGGLTSAGFLQLSPGSQQTGNMNISGNITAGGTYNGNTFSGSQLQFSAASTASLLSANSQQLRLDSGTSGTVAVGDTNATAVTLGKVGTVTNTPGGLNINSGTNVPTTDQLIVDNTSSSGVTSSGVNGVNVKYRGGAAAVESAGMHIDFTPGGTSGGTWSGLRVVEAAPTAAGVTAYGIKLESGNSANGTEEAMYIGTGWDIGLDIQSGGIQLATQSDPAAPTAGLKFYASSVAGRVVPKIIGPAGIDTPLQNALWENNTVLWTPGAAAGVWQGTVGGAVGTAAIVLPTTTNFYTSTRKSSYAPATAAANIQAGIRSELMFFRGNVAGSGGFFAVIHFGTSTWTAGDRLFIGMSKGTTAVTTVNPSTLTDIAGFGIDAGDTAMTFMHNDGATTATKDAIAGQPALASNQGYDAYIFMKPNDGTIYYRLDNTNTGATIIDSSTTTDIVTANTMLAAHAEIGTGTNTTIASALLGITRIYVETDR